MAVLAALQIVGSGWAGSGVDRGEHDDFAFIQHVAGAEVAQACRRV